MDVEQKLQEIFRLLPLQNKVLVYRKNNEEINGKDIKKTSKNDLENLVNKKHLLKSKNWVKCNLRKTNCKLAIYFWDKRSFHR